MEHANIFHGLQFRIHSKFFDLQRFGKTLCFCISINTKRTVHDGFKDYACKCENKFGQKGHLLIHQRTVHDGRKDYLCDKCQQTFGHKSSLLLHQKTVHEGRKDYKCDKCEKKFGTKQHFLYHQRAVHESRKDYACDKCKKKFGVQSNLIRHQKIIHENRKDYKCDKCEKKFGLKSNLLKHQNTHQYVVHKDRKDYECDQCEKRFVKKSNFFMHQKTVHKGRKVKQPDLVKDFTVSPAPFAAGHHFIHFNYCTRLPPSETSSRYTRSISKISPSTFPTAVASSLNNKIDLESLPHIDLISTDTDNCAVIDRLVAEVTDGILEALDAAAPLRLTTLRAKVKPWVTQELRKLMRSRDDAYRSYLRSLSASALARYKQLRRSVKNLLDTAKNTYISKKLASASSPADYWRTLRGIGIASHSTPSPLKFFTPDQLCRYYASVSSASPAINADAVTAPHLRQPRTNSARRLSGSNT
ncbi:unnamed protein product [Trichogramma brassicae]|uniref:C2H2-type domain-containing protein n=1 Tax=Trichogramma brassicae TaxID=86971 RepID=A0A6H5I121_9HYME|nr:unnamed protein product [Trichogramma brassicae]